MARVHQIAVASETGAFEKGIKSGVIQPLEDAEKALKELGDTNVARTSIRDLDAAQRATKNLKAETKGAADAIEDAFRRSFKKAKGDADDAHDKMKHGFREVGEEPGPPVARPLHRSRVASMTWPTSSRRPPPTPSVASVPSAPPRLAAAIALVSPRPRSRS